MLAAAAGCGDAIVVEVDGDLPVGAAGVDAMCLAVADVDPAGGHFGQAYALAELPQTLRVEPGAAAAAEAWVVGYRAGVPVARDAAPLDFADDVTLRLDRCAPGAGGAPAPRGAAVGPGDAVLAPLWGRGGGRVLALGAGASAVIRAADGALVADPGLEPPGAPLAAVALDADGDCDDDALVVGDAGPPVVWRAEAGVLADGGALGDNPARAAAAADVDRDRDIDIVTAAGPDLMLWRNDGTGRFTPDPAALTGAGFVEDVTALGFGDLDGDGSPDLIAGQSAAPLRAFLGDPAGAGVFTGAPAVLPDLAVAVRQLRVADADGDGDPDLWVAVAGGPVQLYIDRSGRLENQSFARLPQPTPEASAIAIGAWDADCTADAALAAPGGGALWRGDATGSLVADGTAPASTGAELVDLDADGDLDLVLATPGGVTWLAR